MLNKIIIFSFLLPIASIASASDDACFEKAQNQMQLNNCAGNAFNKVDQELNFLYRKMHERLKADEGARKLLTDAQKKWLMFRDAECQFKAIRSEGGSIHRMNTLSCLTDLTQIRVDELKMHLNCSNHSDEQTSSSCSIPRPEGSR